MSSGPQAHLKSRLFREFVAIGWCCEEEVESANATLNIAYMGPDDLTPRLLENPFGGQWNRAHVAGWLLAIILSERPMLIGINAPFSFPYMDEDSYFPGADQKPDGYAQLWNLVARANSENTRLLGNDFLSVSEFQAYFGEAEGQGARFRPRLRVVDTELTADLRPASLFDLASNDSQTLASLSVMRLLRMLKASTGRQLAIWPFDRPKPGQPTIVEYNPKVFWRLAGLTMAEIGNIDGLAQALRSFRIQPVSMRPEDATPGLCDLLLSAAAIKIVFAQTESWMPRRMNDNVAKTEGWTFGVS